MAQPTLDHRHVDTCGDQVHCCRVPEGVRGDVLLHEPWMLLRCRTDVLAEAEANTRGTKRLTKAIREDRLVFAAGLTLEQLADQGGCLGPERTDALLPALAHESDLRRRFQTDG